MFSLTHSLQLGDKQPNVTKSVALPEIVYDTVQNYRFSFPLFSCEDMVLYFLNCYSVKMSSNNFCFDLPRKLFILTQFGLNQHLQVTMENSQEK